MSYPIARAMAVCGVPYQLGVAKQGGMPTASCWRFKNLRRKRYRSEVYDRSTAVLCLGGAHKADAVSSGTQASQLLECK